jgi:cyanate permease
VLAFYVLEPSTSGAFSSEYSSFFSTAAQVLAAGLIALILDIRLFTAPRAIVARRAAVLALIFIVIGEIAAITALIPSLPDAVLYRWALALTVGAGVAFLLALLLIAIRTLAANAAEREEEDLRELAAKGDPMANRLLHTSTV